jgi:ribose transport system ATP-binding protein
MAQPEIDWKNNKAPRFEMRSISKRFGPTIALDGVDFSVLPGEIHALVGENGAGKSTLMKILSGAYQPDAGTMLLDRKPFQPSNPLEARLNGVGMIYQELSLAPHLTVEENIVLGMEPSRFGWIQRGQVRKKVLESIRHFEHPELRPETKVRDLSLSARQLVEIGRSLAVGCQVLVFDEPTSSLSQKDSRCLFEIIRDLRDRGLSIVYISHFLEEVEQIADRLTVLRDGRVVGTEKVGRIGIHDIVQMMVGRTVEEIYLRSSRKPGKPVLELSNLTGVDKFNSVNLTLHQGEVLGIAGLVGAGRTELLRAIFGLDPVRYGDIRIGIHTGSGSPLTRWMQGIGMLSENRKDEGLAVALNISDNVTLTKLRGFGPLGLVVPKKQDHATQKWIDRLDIRCLAPRQPVQQLSGGNQQKVALARLLQHDVDVLLLDEPTRGIDVAAKAKMYQIINELVSGQDGQSPKAVLMISSYLPELLGLCDRIAVMHRGILGPARPVRELDEHTLMLAATGKGGIDETM